MSVLRLVLIDGIDADFSGRFRADVVFGGQVFCSIVVPETICYVRPMEDSQNFKRYKIGQAAREIGVKTYVLRFWEGEFDEIEPIRTESGQRLYTEEHLEIIREIKRLLYDEGLTIDGARKKLHSREHSDILLEVRDELLVIKRLLNS